MTWAPWAVFVLGMFMVWTAVYLRTSSFRKATIAALLVGKTFAIVYKLAGLDRTVATLYLINSYTGLVRPVHITAVEVIILAFLSALGITVYWPILTKKLPREARGVLEEIS